MTMLTEFQSMWDCHSDRTSVAWDRIKLLDDNAQPIPSALYRAEPKKRKFETIAIENMLKDNIIELAQTKWATSIVFASKKDGFLQYCDDQRRHEVVKKPDLYPIPRINE